MYEQLQGRSQIPVSWGPARLQHAHVVCSACVQLHGMRLLLPMLVQQMLSGARWRQRRQVCTTALLAQLAGAASTWQQPVLQLQPCGGVMQQSRSGRQRWTLLIAPRRSVSGCR